MTVTADAKLSDAPVIVIQRTFDAPRALVFRMFTDPKHLMQFWGPRGFTSPACEVDLRVGGAFRLHMRAPDGAIYPCSGVYREILEAERIVYAGVSDDSLGCGGGLPPRAVVTLTFAEHAGKTTLTIHTRLQSTADRDAAVETGFNAGWADSLDRLAAYLANTRI